MQGIIIGLAAVNIVAAAVTATDKICARQGAWRVPERVLWTLAVCGGAVGMLLTMRTVRHKTKHRRFMIGLPLLIAAQVSVVLILMADGKFPM